MMLGKRGRPNPFRRTTSMTGIAADVENTGPPPPPGGEGDQYSGYSHMMLSPRYLRNDMKLETADFLRRCGLCRHHLSPGHDIYMYRGDTAFCSLECREQQMKQDERKERRAAAAAATKNGDNHHRLELTVGTTGKSESVAAA